MNTFGDIQDALKFLTLIQGGGMGILVFIIWYFDLRKERHRESQHRERIEAFEDRHRTAVQQHKEELGAYRDSQNNLLAAMERERNSIIGEFKGALAESRQMYINNASLVKRYESLVMDFKGLTTDLKDAYILNTQTMSAIAQAVRTHQYCPIVRQRTGTDHRRERPLDENQP